MLTATSDGLADFGANAFLSPVFIINQGVVNVAHKRNLATVLFNQFRDIIVRNTTLPDINPHFDHQRNQIGGIGIAVVDHQLDAVGFIEAVDFFIGGNDKFSKHLRRHKRIQGAAPVVMMEETIWFIIFDQFSRIAQFVIDDVVDQGMHFFRFFIETHQAIFHPH